MQRSARKRIAPCLWGALGVLWLLYIFSLSAKTADASSMQSHGLLLSLIHLFLPNATATETASLLSLLSVPIRKCAHMALFFALSGIIFAFVKSFSGKLLYFSSFLFTIAFAAADEIHQAFVPGRGPAVFDVFIDSLGAFLALALFYLILKGMQSAKCRMQNY